MPRTTTTWLYEAVHLSGIAHLRERDENRGHGEALIAVSEARLPKQPWDLAQMEPTKRETMLASIRVIDLVVDEIEGQSKLNQHKSDEDHVAVANQLARAEETGSRRLGREDAGVAAGAWVWLVTLTQRVTRGYLLIRSHELSFMRRQSRG
jgi:transcriptional regulator